MAKNEQLASELVCLWVERSVGSRESFGYIISSFLNEHPLIETRADVEEILSTSRKMAEVVVMRHPNDVPLQLSHKAFTSALDNFISFFNYS